MKSFGHTLWEKWCDFACMGMARADVLRWVLMTHFKDALLSVVTSVAASLFFYKHYVFVREQAVFIVVLWVWVLTTVVYFALSRYLMPQLQPELRVDYPRMRFYKGISLIIGTTQCLALSCIAIAVLFKGHDGFNSPAVLGALLFYVGLMLNTYNCIATVMIGNAVLIAPMVVFLALRRQETDLAITVFLVLLIIAVYGFARSQRHAFITQIEQKAQLEQLSVELQEAKNIAEQANLAKSHFFTSASHDARQPLQAISLLSESLVRSPDMQPKDRILVDKIVANLHSIRNLFNRVLDISRIEGGGLQAQMQVVRLSEVFEQLAQQHNEIAEHNRLWLRFVPTQTLVWHDPEILKRILGNIIHNALKFTEHGGVWVAYRAQRGGIEIRDSGIGIEQAHQKRIFQDFYQVNNIERRRDSGMGLGLSIVSRMAQLTDTQIGLRSAPQRGSVFTVSCLEYTPEGGALSRSDSVDEGGLDAEHLVSASGVQGMHLLYVEDDDELRALFTQALRACGLRVTACADMQAVEEYLQSETIKDFAALLTDYRLPDGHTGISVAKRIRHVLGHDLPTLILTGDTQVMNDPMIAALDGVHVLQKPVQMQDLIRLLRECVGKS